MIPEVPLPPLVPTGTCTSERSKLIFRPTTAEDGCFISTESWSIENCQVHLDGTIQPQSFRLRSFHRTRVRHLIYSSRNITTMLKPGEMVEITSRSWIQTCI